MAYEKIVSVPSTATSGQVPQANGVGGFSWGDIVIPESVQMELVWENASPTSDFGNTTIPVTLLPNQFVVIECLGWKSSNYIETALCRVGKTTSIIHDLYTNSVVANRVFSFYTDGVVCSEGVEAYRTQPTSWATQNGDLIPLRIYSIKGVTENV